jgi:hypothetical protein
MKLSVIIVCVLLFLSVQTFVSAQGCSDAGFCSMGGLKPIHHAEQIKATTVSIGSNLGFADYGILVAGGIIDIQHSFSPTFSAGAKVTSLLQSGKQTTQFGLSDLFINGALNVDNNFSIIGGIKIPLSSANKTINGRSLPMDYQSSLGTVDAIVGIAFSVDDFQFQIGYQHPLTQNENTFIPFNELGTTLDFSEFQNTYRYGRAADALFRVSYSVLQNNDWSIMVGVLPIYHLSEDTYKDNFPSSISFNQISGSQGFTINTNLFLRYNLSSRSALELTLAAPVKTRTARPDGLTRGFISTLDYKFSF